MLFADREDAARKLATALAGYRGERPLVLAIPRGAVPMGAIIAEALEGELDVVLVRKLGAPGNPEFAVGAVAESGWQRVESYAAALGADEAYLAQEKARQMAAMRERRARWASIAPIDPAHRVVIVVDDGMATGATMAVALQAIREKLPKRLVCAVPVASREALTTVRSVADDVVCLDSPEPFYAVGRFYGDFRQVEDAEVLAVLSRFRAEAKGDAQDNP